MSAWAGARRTRLSRHHHIHSVNRRELGASARAALDDGVDLAEKSQPVNAGSSAPKRILPAEHLSEATESLDIIIILQQPSLEPWGARATTRCESSRTAVFRGAETREHGILAGRKEREREKGTWVTTVPSGSTTFVGSRRYLPTLGRTIRHTNQYTVSSPSISPEFRKR